jgi:hypothetical protein
LRHELDYLELAACTVVCLTAGRAERTVRMPADGWCVGDTVPVRDRQLAPDVCVEAPSRRLFIGRAEIVIGHRWQRGHIRTGAVVMNLVPNLVPD